MVKMLSMVKMLPNTSIMNINIKKTEGIRCGSLRRKPIPLVPELQTDLIKWVKKGEWIRLLGIPFWECFDVNPCGGTPFILNVKVSSHAGAIMPSLPE